MKRCSKCKKWKSLSEFYKDKRNKDCCASHCKSCRRKYNRKYRQTHQISKVKRAEYAKDYKETLVGCLRIRFNQMRQRCDNSNNPGYKNYGGRSIKCLFKSSQEFVDYVINDLGCNIINKIRNLTIDRINNDGNYEKGNIHFVTIAENNKNKRKYYKHRK